MMCLSDVILAHAFYESLGLPGWSMWVWCGLGMGGLCLNVGEWSEPMKPTIENAVLFALVGPIMLVLTFVTLPFYLIYRVGLTTYKRIKSKDDD